MKSQTLKKRFLLGIVISLGLYLNVGLSSPLDASSESVKKGGFEVKGKNEPIIIKSDHLEGDNKKNVIRFTGNVVATRGDVTIHSESICIFYDKASKSVKEIIAEGGVKISQGNRIATGEQAVFMNSEDKITLTGNPKVVEGDNVIKGAKISLFLAEDRGVVEADEHTRVNATIHIPDDEGEKRD